jgi:hypothetical protein
VSTYCILSWCRKPCIISWQFFFFFWMNISGEIHTRPMSTNSSSNDGDLESQQAVLLIAASNTPSTHWSRIYLILRVRLLILRERNRKLRADRANKASLALDRSSTSSSTSYYSIISTDGTAEAVSFLSGLSWINYFYGARL